MDEGRTTDLDEVTFGTSAALPELESTVPSTRRVASRKLVALAAIGLLVCTGGPSYYIAQHLTHPPGDWSSWMYILPFSAVAVLGGVALGGRLMWRPARRWPWPLFAVGAYVVWALLSTVWSVSQSITPTAAVLGVGIAAFGSWFGWCMPIDDQIWAVTVAMAAASISSALVIEFRPMFGKMYVDLGFPEATVPWQGIFGNRNSLAPVCVLGLIGLVGLIARRPSVRRVLFSAPVAVVHIVLLHKSGGLTSVVALIAVGLCAVTTLLLRLVKRLGVPGPAMATVVVGASITAWFVVFANLDRISSRLGGDITFDNRRLIWADVRSFIRVHPVRGYGFMAFWDRSDLTAESYSRLGAYGSAHNSVLEVLLMLGLVGLIIYLVICGAAVLGPFVWIWRNPSIAAWWWCLVVVFLVAQNLTESFVLWHSYIWVLFLASAVAPFGSAARRDMLRPVDLDAAVSVPDSTREPQPSERPQDQDVWATSASSIAELLGAGDIEN